jgi:hypothetical protein
LPRLASARVTLPFDSLRVSPDEALVLPSGERVFLYRSGWSDVQPAAPLALRLFVPVGESAYEAGAGQILRSQAEARMRAVAARYGFFVQVERTAGGLAYWASGPASELDTMIWALNEGLRAPDPTLFAALRRDQLAVVLRNEETPEAVLASRLRGRLGTTRPPLRGTRSALEAMDAGVVGGLWARTHARRSLEVVAVGPITPATLLAALSDLDLPAETPMIQRPPAGAPVAARGAPETIRFWMAEAWAVERTRDPRALVAVRLLGDAARQRSQAGELDMGAELWDLDGRWYLVLSGATYPARSRSLQPSLEGLLPDVQGALEDARIRTEALRIRRDLLQMAASPVGMARLAGEAVESGQDPAVLAGLLRELEILETTDMRRFLERLRATAPVREELRP